MTDEIADAIEATLAQARRSKDAPSFNGAIEKLSNLGSEAIAPLLDAARAEKVSRARLILGNVIPAYGRPAWEPLLVVARHDDSHDFGWIVVWAVDGFSKLLMADDFIAALRHPNVYVRWSAALALEKFADPRAIESLIELLSEDGLFARPLVTEATPAGYHAKVRLCAARALHSIGVPALPALLAALESPNPHVREGAAQALKGIDDLRIFEPLVAAVHDADTKVRLAVLQALVSLTSQLTAEQRDETLPVFLSALQESDWRLMEEAANGLAALDELAFDVLYDRASQLLERDSGDGAATNAVYALKLMLKRQPQPSERVARLVKLLIAILDALQSPPVARRLAAEALEIARDEQAVAPLSSAVIRETEPYVRIAAAKALRTLGDKSALPALRDALAEADAITRRDGDSVSEADSDLQFVLKQAIDALERRTDQPPHQ